MKQTNRKGFTLAELLIVVAIIAVLVAIAIPVFTSQLHKSRVAADQANLRAYYAELQADLMTNGKVHTELNIVIPGSTVVKNNKYKHIDGTVSETKEGYVYFMANGTYEDNPDGNIAYMISYTCNKGCPEHNRVFSN